MKKIIIGTRAISGDFKKIPRKNIYNILEFIIEKGFHHFDTSEVYGNGLADEILSDFKIYNILVDIKCGYNKNFIKTFNLDDINRTIEKSLKKFKKINTLYLHNPREEIKNWGKINDLLNILKSQKIIKYSGISIARDPKPYYFTKKILTNFDCIQDEYNLLKQPIFSKIPKKSKIVARSVFASGLLNPNNYDKNDMRGQIYDEARSQSIIKQIICLKKIFGDSLLKSSYELVYFDKRVSNLILSFSNIEQVVRFLNMHKLKNRIKINKIKKFKKIIRNNFNLNRLEIGY